MDERWRIETIEAFHEAVNMDSADLASWLDTPQSQAVGWPRDRAPGMESVGHASGRRILTILQTPIDRLSDDDLRHMRKVVGYVRRHLRQRPMRDIMHSRWRFSLMNWGHDPIR